MQGRVSSLRGQGLQPMDDRSLSSPDANQPLPVVVTLDTGTASTNASPLSFTIPLHKPQNAPSWLELLGQR